MGVRLPARCLLLWAYTSYVFLLVFVLVFVLPLGILRANARSSVATRSTNMAMGNPGWRTAIWGREWPLENGYREEWISERIDIREKINQRASQSSRSGDGALLSGSSWLTCSSTGLPSRLRLPGMAPHSRWQTGNHCPVMRCAARMVGARGGWKMR